MLKENRKGGVGIFAMDDGSFKACALVAPSAFLSFPDQYVMWVQSPSQTYGNLVVSDNHDPGVTTNWVLYLEK